LLSKFARQAQAAHPDLVAATGASPVYTPVNAPYAIFREALEMLTGDVDSASIGLLGYLGIRLAKMGTLMVFAYRPEKVNRGR
jgi:hypothetical protein